MMAFIQLRHSTLASIRLKRPSQHCSLREPHVRFASPLKFTGNTLPADSGDQNLTHGPRQALVRRAVKNAGEIMCGAILFPMPAIAIEQLGGIDFKPLVSFVNTHGEEAPVVFYLIVTMAELVPLVPTQPFALSAGLLLGGYEGTLVVWAGTLTAAIVAFQVGRGAGQQFVRRLLDMEGDGETDKNMISAKLSDIQEWIDKGSYFEQLWGMVLLRLTPVIPFSASNYGLSLTVLPFWVFTVGTAIGMIPWVAFYAFVGSTGRALLNKGVDVAVIFEGFSEKIDAAFDTYGLAGVGAFATASVALTLSKKLRNSRKSIKK